MTQSSSQPSTEPGPSDNRVRRQRAWRSLMWLLACIMALLVMAYLFRAPLLMHTANTLLRSQGVEITSLHGMHASLGRLQIDTVELLMPDSQTPQTLEDIVAHFTLKGLRQGNIDILTIRRATLHMPDTAAGTHTEESGMSGRPREPLDSGGLMALLMNLPVQHVEIHDLNLSPWLISAHASLGKETSGLRVTLSTASEELLLKLDWPPAAAVSSRLRARTLQGSLTLHSEGNPVVDSHFTLRSHDRTGMLSHRSELHLHAVHALLARYAVPGIPSLESSTLAPQESLQLTQQLQISGDFLSPDKLVATTELQREARLELPAALLPVEMGFSDQSLVHLTLPAGLRAHAEHSPDSFQFSAQVQAQAIHLTSSAVPGVQELAISFRDILAACQAAAQCQASLHSTASASSLSLPGVELGPIAADFHLALTLDGDLLKLRLEPGAEILINSATAPLGDISNLALLFAEASQFHIDLRNNTIQAEMSRISASVPLVRLEQGMFGMQLDINSLSLHNADAPFADINFELRHLYTNLVDINLWDYRFATHATFVDQKLSLATTASLHEQPVFHIAGSHWPDDNTGHASIELPALELNESGRRLSDFINPLPGNMDLLRGRLSGSAELYWNLRDDAWQPGGPLQLTVEDLAGFYEETVFAGFSSSFHGELLENFQLRSDGLMQARIDSIDPGIAVQDISFAYALDTSAGQYSIRALQAGLFGGRISSEGVDYNPHRESNSMEVHLDRIDLSRALSLSAYEGVQATGLLSGVLPLTIKNHTITVADGRLEALRPGGTIKYTRGAAGSGNPSLDLVYRALADYRYSRFEAQVDYLEDGELLLDVRMEGLSPELNAGQRINLNLSISDNIPALLESLQATRSITEALQRRLESR